MRKKTVYIAMLIGAVCLSGCSRWTKLQQKVYKVGKADFSAELPADWMRFNLAKGFLMTRDGVILNVVTVERFKFNKVLENTKKVFYENMTPQEIAEVEMDNIRAKGVDQFEVLLNEPIKVDGQGAYHIEYTYEASGGLKKHGQMYGFIRDERVYRITYEAAQQHYYLKSLPDFEKFIETFRLI